MLYIRLQGPVCQAGPLWDALPPHTGPASKLQGWPAIWLQATCTRSRAGRALVAADTACSCCVQTSPAHAAALQIQTHFGGCNSHLCGWQVKIAKLTHPGVA